MIRLRRAIETGKDRIGYSKTVKGRSEDGGLIDVWVPKSQSHFDGQYWSVTPWMLEKIEEEIAVRTEAQCVGVDRFGDPGDD